MTPAQKQVFDAMRRHGFLTDDYYDLTKQREKVKKEREEKWPLFLLILFMLIRLPFLLQKQQPNLPENQLLLFEWRALPSLVSRVLVR